MRIVVLGVGNILLSDEGVGVRAVEQLQSDYQLSPDIEVIDGGTSAMEMLDNLANADHLIIVDAVRGGRPPATMIRIAEEDVPVFFKTKFSPHQIGLSDVLATLSLMGERPRAITVIGVEPASLDTAMALTPQVQTVLPKVVEQVVKELRQLGQVVERNVAEAV